MNNITIFIIFGLLVFKLSAQHPELVPGNYSCSYVKAYHNHLKNSKDIIQTPRLHDYDVSFYHLDLEIENDTTYLEGNVTFVARVTANVLDTFAFELIDEMVIDSVLFNGVNVDFFRENDEVFAALPASLEQNELFESTVYYYGTPPQGDFFIGVSQAYDSTWNKSVVWTLSEPFNARQWWPVKQVLDDKADSVWVFLTTSEGNRAGSNGLLTNVVQLAGNKIRYEWKSNYPIAYYLISYAVSEYQEYNIYGKPAQLQGDSILIQNYIYDAEGCLEKHKFGIDRTVPIIELLSDLYSLYPFYEEKYGHCLTKLSGGMEHQTMTTIGEGFGLGLVAHELAHMWFGNSVTCATWSDIWVNEGFATYTDYLAHEKIAGQHWPAKWLNLAHNYVISEPDGSVYVPPEEVEYGNEARIFNSRLSYFKGALILHMIRYDLNNDDLFFEVFRNYQQQFKDSVATADDFVDVLNATTGIDFTSFFEQWFYGEGHPVYDIDWSVIDGVFEISSQQTPSAGNITPFFEMDLPVRLFFHDGGDTTIVLNHTQPLVIKSVNIEKGVDSIQVDPHNWMLKKVASINGFKDEYSVIDFQVTPVPATSSLFINSAENKGFKGCIVDLQGKKSHYFQSEKNSIKLNVESLETGLYFIHLEKENSKKTIKFIKH